MLIALLSIITQRQYLLGFLEHYYNEQMPSKLSQLLASFAEQGIVPSTLNNTSLLECLCNPKLGAKEVLSQLESFIDDDTEREALILHPITGPFLRG